MLIAVNGRAPASNVTIQERDVRSGAGDCAVESTRPPIFGIMGWTPPPNGIVMCQSGD
jgi:hypothetical protein